MAWIESHQELGNHPKTRKLARLLGIGRVTAVGHLQFLWWWATDYASDGRLARFEPLDVAVGAEWEGDPGAFLAALVDAGFVDPDLTIHDWDLYGGKLAERRRQDAERKRAARTRATSGGRPPDVREAAHVDKRREEDTREPPPPTPPPHRNGTAAMATEERTPTSTNGAPTAGTYADLIAEPFPAIRDDFRRLDPELTAPWLRKALRNAEPRAGPLSAEQVVSGLELAILKIQRAVANPSPDHPIRNLTAFASAAVAESLKAQNHAD